MGKKLATFVLALGLPFLSAWNCEDATIKMKTEEDISWEREKSPEEIGLRYEIRRVGVFEDNLAYENKRGVYEIIDTKTGKEYFGISGIGITEVGSHGKSEEDER